MQNKVKRNQSLDIGKRKTSFLISDVQKSELVFLTSDKIRIVWAAAYLFSLIAQYEFKFTGI